ncbi:hypothetical protein AMJ87_13100 [candidate division WOR_3 bacterium SM23_60]|uniref:Thiamine-binding protein domain-containing protein n=1 Tax=candidate division WOR_3 bacterium SM23_60 TaxID=1703780 RepID=A0A0S8G4Y0_UNCW3|nr:MAG: hypothetical protein AMJ87_13100 [candidate division WOR_3 bacterium SM23_60]
MSFMAFVSMTPLGKGVSVSTYVAKVIDVIDTSGLSYTMSPMGTIVEGETWDEVMDVLKRGFEQMKQECSRISIAIKVDYREGKSGRLKTKIASVEDKLGRKVHRTTE